MYCKVRNWGMSRYTVQLKFKWTACKQTRAAQKRKMVPNSRCRGCTVDSTWATLKNPGVAGECLLSVYGVRLQLWPRQVLMLKTTPTPDVADDMRSTTLPTAGSAAEDETITMSIPARQMDESGQRLERAVAVAIACPVGVHPGINKHCSLLLQIGQLLE
jgi:hypothetical protein